MTAPHDGPRSPWWAGPSLDRQEKQAQAHPRGVIVTVVTVVTVVSRHNRIADLCVVPQPDSLAVFGWPRPAPPRSSLPLSHLLGPIMRLGMRRTVMTVMAVTIAVLGVARLGSTVAVADTRTVAS